MNQKKYYRSSELKQRGWTEGLIRKFLPKPDETKTNPIIRSAAPMKLYKIKRVERIEKSEKFVGFLRILPVWAVFSISLYQLFPFFWFQLFSIHNHKLYG